MCSLSDYLGSELIYRTLSYIIRHEKIFLIILYNKILIITNTIPEKSFLENVDNKVFILTQTNINIVTSNNKIFVNINSDFMNNY